MCTTAVSCACRLTACFCCPLVKLQGRPLEARTFTLPPLFIFHHVGSSRALHSMPQSWSLVGLRRLARQAGTCNVRSKDRLSASAHLYSPQRSSSILYCHSPCRPMPTRPTAGSASWLTRSTTTRCRRWDARRWRSSRWAGRGQWWVGRRWDGVVHAHGMCWACCC